MLDKYKKRHLNKNLICINCSACGRGSFESKYYQTQNLLFLHTKCYEAIKEYLNE